MLETEVRPLLRGVMKRAADHLVPFQVTIEVTHRCNLSCKHCYVDIRDSDELSLAQLKDILDQLAAAGTMYLMFTGGEPLLRRDFFDIASYAKERGFVIMILTNGTMVDTGAARQMAALEAAYVGISLHGVTPEIHDDITRTPGSFEATVRGIKLLRQFGVDVYTSTLLMDSNIHQAGEVRELAERLGTHCHIGHEFVPTRAGSVAVYDYEAGFADICRHFDQELVTFDGKKSKERSICRAGHGICSISPHGDVFPCLLMPMKVGNLRQATFAEIWRDKPSPELTRLRSITWQDLSGCHDCRLAKYCRRCMGAALVETGELTKPAPSACRYAALKSELLRHKGVIA